MSKTSQFTRSLYLLYTFGILESFIPLASQNIIVAPDVRTSKDAMTDQPIHAPTFANKVFGKGLLALLLLQHGVNSNDQFGRVQVSKVFTEIKQNNERYRILRYDRFIINLNFFSF